MKCHIIGHFIRDFNVDLDKKKTSEKEIERYSISEYRVRNISNDCLRVLLTYQEFGYIETEQFFAMNTANAVSTMKEQAYARHRDTNVGDLNSWISVINKCFNLLLPVFEKLRTSKGVYWFKQRFSLIVPLFKIGTFLKEKNMLPKGANSFLWEKFLMIWDITFTA